MAQFYAEIQGNRGLASRMGTKNSGIWGHIRGWHLGVRVSGGCTDDGEDYFDVDLTSGSTGGKRSVSLGRFTAKELEARNET